MNATENVRGINFRLSYLTPEQQISIHPSSNYASIFIIKNRMQQVDLTVYLFIIGNYY